MEEGRARIDARFAALVQLRDPDSAQFGPLYAGVDGYYCGTVNARNAFGGYTGFQRFVVTPKGVAVFVDDPSLEKLFADWWPKYCESR